MAYEKFVTETWPEAVGKRMITTYIDPSMRALQQLAREGAALVRNNEDKQAANKWWGDQRRSLVALQEELKEKNSDFAKLNLKKLQLPVP